MHWWLGFLLGFLFLNDALATDQPLSFLNGLAGAFLWLAVMLNYYGKK
jgi:hypothetical protein